MITMHIFINNKYHSYNLTRFVPREGDEVRLAKGKYYKVIRIVWCFDEDDCLMEKYRCNVELKKVR